MRLGMSGSLGLAAIVGVLAMPPLPCPGSAFSLFGDMPGVFFDGGDGGSGSGGSGGGEGGQGGGNQGGQQQQQGKTYTEAEWNDLQKQLSDANGKVKTFEDKDKTDAEKQADDLKNEKAAREASDNRVKETQLQLAIERGARKLNIVDEDSAFKLLDRSAVKYDKDGNPTNVQSLLEELIKAKPWLVGTTSGNGGSITNGGRQRDGDKPKDLRGGIAAHYAKN